MTTGGRPRKNQYPGDIINFYAHLDVSTFLREQANSSNYLEELVRSQPEFQHWMKTFKGPQWPKDKVTFTTAEASRYLGVDRSTVQRWCEKGFLAHTVLGVPGGKKQSLLIDRAALDALKKAREGMEKG